MKTRETTPGKTYSVHTTSGCTVSDKNGWSKTIDAPDGYFTAHAGEVTIDGDDAADIRELFKLAPQQRLAILGVLGGNAGGLPAGYTRVEWIGKKGSEYLVIDEPYTAGISGFWARASFFETNVHSTDLWGVWNESDPSRLMYSPFVFAARTYPGISPSTSTYGRFGAHAQRYDGSYVDGDIAEFGASWFSPNKMEAILEKHNVVYDSMIETLSITSENQPIFALKVYTGTTQRFSSRGEIRVYEVKMSQGQEETRHLVPCLDNTGAPCMFDLMKRKTYYNQGTGDFTYPTESTTYSLRRVLPDWGKLTEHGLRRLYHAPANYNGELYDYALENGYKPIVETEQPEDGYWVPRWTETEDEIVLEWVETEPPMDEFGLPEETLTETE